MNGVKARRRCRLLAAAVYSPPCQSSPSAEAYQPLNVILSVYLEYKIMPGLYSHTAAEYNGTERHNTA